MHRGYVKEWRQEVDSEIWDKPPLYFKVWRWLLMSVDYKTGELTTTCNIIADKVQWVENNQPKIPNRKSIMDILRWLEEVGSIRISVCGTGNRKYLLLVVVNYSTYRSGIGGVVTEMKQKPDSL